MASKLETELKKMMAELDAKVPDNARLTIRVLTKENSQGHVAQAAIMIHGSDTQHAMNVMDEIIGALIAYSREQELKEKNATNPEK